MKSKILSIQTLLWLALVLALAGSLRHVGWAFASLEDGNLVMGYVQGIAIDVGLLALALGIQQRKRQRRATWTLWGGVVLFSGVSTFANLLHGLAHQADIALAGYDWLVALRPVLLSGILPLLVIYLSEIIGDDVNYAAKADSKDRLSRARDRIKMLESQLAASITEQPVLATSATNVNDTTTLSEQGKLSRQVSADQKVDRLLTFYVDNPDATQADAATVVGRSRSWVSIKLSELEQEGVIKRNGDGVQVLAADNGHVS